MVGLRELPKCRFELARFLDFLSYLLLHSFAVHTSRNLPALFVQANELGKTWAKRIWTIFLIAQIDKKIALLSMIGAETRGFEPPIPFRENLISSEAH